ncbi:PDR/VanB family oxidoreductase [Gordonia sp. OPL2]|uniref:PDR/VanB family oxidoreductase n=1 Tax=Gordonia sp. OPL2 TaxID=2486274 RepID=UPI0021CCBCA5|nr:PDR/VanB family oxidoreductase [Gordonia sp. OPL2]
MRARSSRRTLIVTDIVDAATGIRSFTLAAPDGAVLPGFVPGSHLIVGAGDCTNAYSLTNDGVAPTSYQISVLRLADGNGGSRWMHDMLSVGDAVEVELPRSAFPPAARATKHLLVAGGIGVTPILSHLRAATRWNRDVQVLYTFRPGCGAHVDEIIALAGREAELFVDQSAFTERLTATLADQPIGTHLYLCGPSGMIDHVVATARGQGWPESRIHLERFGADALDAGEPFTVRLTESGLTVDIPSGTSVLEALEGNGIAVANRCRQGVCGECRIPLSAGTADHRDLYLSDDEKSAGDAFMPCVSRAAAGCTLEVPL